MAHSRLNRVDNCHYTLNDDSTITVASKDSGEEGVFDENGMHISGTLKQADVQMCSYIAKLGKHRAATET